MCYSALVRRDLERLERLYGAEVIREQYEEYFQASAADPKHFPELADRIYPGHYAPVLFNRGAERSIGIMRYGAYPPPHIKDPSRYTTFNARLDNLSSPFWSEAFGHHHGFVVLNAFYEWVQVKDLLAAGVITLAQVKADFARQAAERRQKVESAGKKWQPTPTEAKDPRFRKIIIEFRPEDAQDLLVPVIFSTKDMADGRVDAGFAIVTHDPPPEIAEAGHDRCPVVLDAPAIDTWLHPQGKTPEALQEVLAINRRVHFTHALPAVA